MDVRKDWVLRSLDPQYDEYRVRRWLIGFFELRMSDEEIARAVDGRSGDVKAWRDGVREPDSTMVDALKDLAETITILLRGGYDTERAWCWLGSDNWMLGLRKAPLDKIRYAPMTVILAAEHAVKGTPAVAV